MMKNYKLTAKKNYKLTILLFFCSILLGYGQTITFNVDFGTTDPPSGKEFKIGGQIPGATGFNGTLAVLTDTDNDGIYTGTLTLTTPGRLQFRIAQADTGATGYGGGFSWISDITSLPCSFLEKQDANYKTNVFLGQNKTISFVFNECISEVITWNNNATTNDWNTPANWVGGVVPTANNSVLINEGTVTTKFPTITSGTVNVRNIVMQNQTSLIINGGATFTGEVMYRRFLPDVGRWFSLAPPFNNDRVESFLFRNQIKDNSDSFKKALAPYDNTQTDVNLRWAYTTSSSTGDLIEGKGYTVQAATPSYVEFIGNINTGASGINQSVSIGAANAYNLIGNPYTSYINSKTLLDIHGGGTGSTSDIIEKTIWVWDGANTTYVTKTAAQAFRVAPTQSFFVKAKAPGTVNFELANQEHAILLTFQRTAPETEVKLEVENNNVKRYINLYYTDKTTKGFDNGYDGELFGGLPNGFELYSQLLSDNLGAKYQVQSLPDSNYETMIVPVGLKIAANKEVTFSAEALNLPAGIHVYLEDRANNIFTRLDEENSQYTITTTSAIDGVGRFYIHTSSNAILSTPNAILESVSVYASNNSLNILGLKEGNATVKMFNVLGKQVLNNSFNATLASKISLPQLAKGVYIVQLQTAKGQVNKKIILN